jgi:hypothetical protein
MKAKVAVATVSGKAYFLLISELKERRIEFLSVVPGEPLPAEATVVITTEQEKPLIKHEKVLVYDADTEPSAVVSEAVKILQGKEAYEKIVVGIDPGEVTGLAVIADGKVNQTKACLNTHEVVSEVKTMIKNVNFVVTVVVVKIGNGIPLYKTLLAELDSALPSEVVLEIVSEAGTDKLTHRDKHRRGLRDIASAIRIAGRAGRVYPRVRREEKEE